MIMIKKHSLRISINLLILILLISSCKEDNILNKMVLSEVIFADSNIKYLFHYNSQGSIEKFEIYYEEELVQYYYYSYSRNAIDKVVKYEKSGSDFISPVSELYIYDSKARLIEKLISVNNSTYSTSIVWLENRISKLLYYTETKTLSSYDELYYDLKGNITKVYNYKINSNHEYLDKVIEYSHDSEINPLHEIAFPTWTFFGNLGETTSVNNITRTTEKQNIDSDPYKVIDINYTYNNSGFPTNKMITTRIGSTILSSKIEFIYKII
ncbi:MAG: hypothetical protein ACK5OS_01150 [Chryseotalea sp.]